MDPALYDAIERARRALELSTIVGEWEEAARLSQRLSVYYSLAARNDAALQTDR